MTITFDYQTLKNLKTTGRFTDPTTKGLQLLVKANQKKYWVYRYTLLGKQRNIGLGVFPTVSIKEARLKAQKAMVGLSEGIDPKTENKSPSITENNITDMTFAEFATQWVANNESAWTNQKHANQWLYTLRDFAFPIIGNKQLQDIDENDVLKILQPIWLNKTETASRLRGRLERIFSAARFQKLRSGINPAAWKGHLDAVLPSPKAIKRQRGEKHHKALPYRELPEFIRQLREQEGLSALALEFLVLNANRTGEVLLAKWDEIRDEIWVVPAYRMKAKKEHRIPLCSRSIEILTIARAETNGIDYIFSKKNKPLSNMSMSAVLKRMCVDATVHGFRSTFRDWVAEETDFSPEVAEMALAHTIANKVEAAYRRGDLLERRKRLMEAWADYCESKPSNNIISLKAA
jgi:integrase